MLVGITCRIRYFGLKVLQGACLWYDKHRGPVDYFDGRAPGTYEFDVLVKLVASEDKFGAYGFHYLEVDSFNATYSSDHNFCRSSHSYASVARVSDVGL